uniref:Myosin binding protein C1 n=1 Tax=Eptatretus burgeri TaxID=7764 RepID=A0A8C4PYE5_EPTBU
MLTRKPNVKWFKGKWLDLASKAGKHLQFIETFDRNTKIHSFEMKIIKAKDTYAGNYRCEASLMNKSETVNFDLTVEGKKTATFTISYQLRYHCRSDGADDSGELDFSGLLKKREVKTDVSAEPEVDVWEILKDAKPSEYEKIAFQYGITDLRGLLRRLKRMKKVVQKTPGFLKKLEPAYQVEKGQKARFVVELEDSAAEVKWFKNGQEIRPSAKIFIESKGGERILIVNNCQLTDDATYEVSLGKEVSKTELFVAEPPVRVTKLLEDTTVREGERVELSCEVSEEGAKVKWMKDGVEIPVDEIRGRFRYKREGLRHILVITEARLQDLGKYSVITTGGESHAKLAFASLRFRLHKFIIEKCTLQDSGEYKFVPKGYKISPSCRIIVMDVPRIDLSGLELKDGAYVVVAGTKLRLDIPIMGEPAPKVSWNRGNQGIPTTGGRIRAEAMQETSSLVIDVVERDDEATYSIQAKNEAGVAHANVKLKVIDFPDPPSAPEITSIGGDWCVCAWKPPAYDGGLPILGYVIERKKKQSNRWMRLNFDTWKELTFEAKNMMEGVPYEMKVFAVNSVGTSAPSDPSRTFVPLAATSQPTHVGVDDITDTTVFLKWRPPERIGAAGLDGYRIEYCIEGEDKWVCVNPNKLIENPGSTIRDLPTGASLFFRIFAVNLAGESEPGIMSQPVTIREKVEKPRILLPRQLRQAYIKRVGEPVNIVIPFMGKPRPKVAWLKEGKAVDTSQVNIRNSDTDTILFIRKCCREDSGKYELSVTVEDFATKATIKLQVVEKPGPPTNIKIVDVWESTAELTWSPPRDNGNATITGYTIQKADKKTMEWFTVCEHVRRPACTVSDLIIGNEYYFRIFSENMCGLSEEGGQSKDSARICKTGKPYKNPLYNEHDFTEAPIFSHPLVDLQAVAGYNTTLSCCCRGNPKPKFLWLKNKMEITDNPRYRMLINQGVCSLEIRKPSSYDGGVYTCSAVNPLGEAEVSCKLEVKVIIQAGAGNDNTLAIVDERF